MARPAGLPYSSIELMSVERAQPAPRAGASTTVRRLLRSPSTIRGALVAGLAIMCGLWLLTGYELLRSLDEIGRRVNAVEASFDSGLETLSTVRTNVLLGSIYLRDALVDTAGGSRQQYLAELKGIRAEIETLLPAYLRQVELPVELHEWEQLELGLDDYWKSLDLVFGPNAPSTYLQGTGILRREVVPARNNVLQILDRLAALQRASQERQEEDMALLYRSVRTRFLAIGGLASLIGAVVACLVFLRIGVLEREIQRRRFAEADNRHDLERLSARLLEVQEDERRILARELHDEVGQALTALKMDIRVAMRSRGTDTRAAAALEEARTIAESVLQSVRDLSQLLHPSMLDDFGLPEAIAAYLKNFSRRTAIRAELTTGGLAARLAPEVEVTVYRIVQEALTNIARHSSARRCTIDIRATDGTLTLRVDDDGIGMPPMGLRERPSRGLGLIGMRERAQSLDGSLLVENRPEGGTRLVVTIPPRLRLAVG
jgi:signal transduction histidine kinase